MPTTLGAEVEVFTGFPFASSQYSDEPASPRLLRGDNVGQGVLRWDDARRWPTDQLEGLVEYFLRDGDVILAMDRPWIEAGLKFAQIRTADTPCLLVQRVARLRAGPRLDQDYLRYLIGSREFTAHVLEVQTGTSVPHISKSQIQEFEFDLPSLSVQRRTAKVLRALDEKIDLNGEMNRTLETMSSALFKSWLEDREAELEARVAGNLERQSVLEIGDGYRAKNSELTTSGEGLPFARAANLNNGFDFRGADRLQSALVPRAGTKVSMPFDAAFTSKGTVGRIAQVLPDTPKFVYSPQVCFWRSRNHQVLHPQILFEWLRSSEFGDQAVAVKGQTDMADYVSLRDQRDMEMTLPWGADQGALGRRLDALRARVNANEVEIRLLTELRDTLLPRLLSGELELKDAERAVGDAA